MFQGLQLKQLTDGEGASPAEDTALLYFSFPSFLFLLQDEREEKQTNKQTKNEKTNKQTNKTKRKERKKEKEKNHNNENTVGGWANIFPVTT